jgi:hypothetical protein
MALASFDTDALPSTLLTHTTVDGHNPAKVRQVGQIMST